MDHQPDATTALLNEILGFVQTYRQDQECRFDDPSDELYDDGALWMRIRYLEDLEGRVKTHIEHRETIMGELSWTGGER